MEEKVIENPVIENNQEQENEIVEKAVSLEACQYERNFGLTQCGCAT